MICLSILRDPQSVQNMYDFSSKLFDEKLLRENVEILNQRNYKLEVVEFMKFLRDKILTTQEPD